MTDNKIVKVLVPNIKGKAIISSNGSIYVIPALAYHKDQEMLYDLEKAIYFPSMLYAMATLYNEDFDEDVNFIKENF